MELGSTNGQLQNRQLEILRQVFLLSIIGLGLLAVVLFAPDANQAQGVFFLPALQSTWSNLFEIPAAWSSIKIILFSIGLFLVIESIGTVLAVFRYKSVALPVFFMQIFPCLSLLCGGYYLVKALL